MDEEEVARVTIVLVDLTAEEVLPLFFGCCLVAGQGLVVCRCMRAIVDCENEDEKLVHLDGPDWD